MILINFTLLSDLSPMSSDSDAIDYTTKKNEGYTMCSKLGQFPGTVLKSILAWWRGEGRGKGGKAGYGTGI